MAYNPLVPTTGHSASQDYVAMQQNFAQVDQSYNTDHVALESGVNIGLHSQVRFALNQAAPTLINAAVSEVFANNPAGSSELFFTNGVPKTYQLTNLPFQNGGGVNFLDLPWNLRLYFGRNTVGNLLTINFPASYNGANLVTAQATVDDMNPNIFVNLQFFPASINLRTSNVAGVIVNWFTLGRLA